MKIIWSPLATERVAEIAEHIALDNPRAAARWTNEIFDKVERLADFPEVGRVLPELGRHEVRELFHGKYRIVYRIDSAISILTVRHGSQLLPETDIGKEDV